MSRVLRLDIDPVVYARLNELGSAARTLGDEIALDFRNTVKRTFIGPLAIAIRADMLASSEKHEHRVAKTVFARSTPALVVGGPSVPYYQGALFGGQSGKKNRQRYSWTNKEGVRKRKEIRRAQTMQFRPHLGTVTYAVFPTWRRMDPQLSAQLVDALDEFVDRHF